MDIMKLTALVALCCLWLTVSAQVQKNTQYGPVLGTEDTFSGKTLHRFRGIPFAKPPVDKLRFLDPREPDSWTDPLPTEQHAPSCLQQTSMYFDSAVNASEDCLYLNVYAPVDAANLPVMVWIYGGSLLVGGTKFYDLETLAVAGEVVVVSINYRLSVFGFLSTGDSVVGGNAGLKDQVMALKWVKDNIANFGGDPNKVTIFGESAGAWSVNMHMVSPVSRGLFHRAISQSGTVYTYFLENTSQRGARSVTLAKDLDCEHTSNSEEILKCLQEMSPERLLSQQGKYLEAFPMVYGDDFLPKHPRSYWDSGNIAQADYMLGFNSEEASTMLDYPTIINKTDVLQNGMDATSYGFLFLGGISTTLIKPGSLPVPSNPVWQLLSDQYCHDFGNDFENLRCVMDMLADVLFIGPTMSNIKAMKENTDRTAFLYYFNQVIEPISPLPDAHIATLIHVTGAPELNLGAGHMSEVAYIFGLLSEDLPDMPANIYNLVTEEDSKVGKAMMNAWVSFAKTGNPQFLASADDSQINWPEYDTSTKHYLEFKYPMSEESIKQRILPDRVSLHTDILPVYLKSLEPPQPPREADKPCDDTPSTIDRNTAETALFILSAVVIVLLLLSLIVLNSYCMMKKQVKQLENEHRKTYEGISNNI